MPDPESKILIVDDSEQNRRLMEEIVQSLGYSTATACDGNEALEVAFDVDLILLDVLMPGIDGFEVTRRIRERVDPFELPVILVTALDSREDRLRAVATGVNDFIAKPIDAVELTVRLASQLRLKATSDELKAARANLERQVALRTEALSRALAEAAEAQRNTHAAHLDTIRRLVVAAEYKDRYTGEHIQRLSQYAVILARALDLPDREIDVLRHAIPMHDVGKLGIPDAILLKEGPLTPAEREIMNRHTVIGAQILSDSSSELLQAGEVIALSHHERWDGTGYPRGLAGRGIPLGGRLCALVDVFDALTSDRPYRPALSDGEAARIMEEGRGTQFDPDLLDVFLARMPEIVEVRGQNRLISS